ncbi:hypothetical protein Tco_0833166 [Tanacetum coccineum]
MISNSWKIRIQRSSQTNLQHPNQTSNAKGDLGYWELLMQGSGRNLNKGRLLSSTFNSSDGTPSLSNNLCLLGYFGTNGQARTGHSTPSYVQIYKHLKAYEPLGQKGSQGNRSSLNVLSDPLELLLKPVKRKALGIVGYTGARGKSWSAKDSSVLPKIRCLLMDSKRKGSYLDAEADAFLADGIQIMWMLMFIDVDGKEPNAAAAFYGQLDHPTVPQTV